MRELLNSESMASEELRDGVLDWFEKALALPYWF